MFQKHASWEFQQPHSMAVGIYKQSKVATVLQN